MRRREPLTQTIKASQARQEWAQLLNKVFRGEARILVEKSGIPVAALVSAEDLQRLTRLEQERQQRFQALEETWAAFQDVPPQEVEREVRQALNEVRAETRQKSERDVGQA